VASIYPFRHQEGLAAGLRRLGVAQPFLLSRSAYAGSQRFGTAVWSGDIESSFEELGKQVRAGLAMALSGIPWWTTDIGGFMHGDGRDPAFRELLARWFQYGIFCPLCRLHGVREPVADHLAGGADNEPWSFGEETLSLLAPLLHLRQRLRPYVMRQMERAATDGLPPMRPLFCDFPEDPEAAGVEDQFLLGPHILVAPVLEAGARSRRLYLPAGRDWLDAWTGVAHRGGCWLEVEAPLGLIPVFLGDAGLLGLFAGGGHAG
jgi:alpha-D-xyloside xylohydrolase